VTPVLESGAINLLLRILEAPRALVSAEALDLANPACGAALLKCGALTAHGHVPAIAAIDDHNDTPVNVIRSNDDKGYGYFSAASGWIDIPADRLLRYRVDIRAAMAAIMPLSMKLTPKLKLELVEDLIWSIGTLGGSKRRLEILFARRFADSGARDRLRKFLGDHPTSNRRVVLTSTAPARLPPNDVLPVPVVALEELMPLTEGRIKAEVLFSRAADTGSRNEPLSLSSDGRQLTIHGTITITFGGPKQRALIRLLFDGYQRGERLSAGYLLETAGAGSHNLPKAFGKKWALLKPYLTCQGGGWLFEV
jgi:hypothetical protein